jgi:hypothetical protein
VLLDETAPERISTTSYFRELEDREDFLLLRRLPVPPQKARGNRRAGGKNYLGWYPDSIFLNKSLTSDNLFSRKQ